MPDRFHRRLQLIPWAILTLGLALTWQLQDSARVAARAMEKGEFQFRVAEVVENIERRMQRYEQVLEGAAGLFSASPDTGRDEFAAYVRALRLETKFPGIQGVGFSLRIPAEALAAHIERVRSEGFPQYDIRPAGAREGYTSIVHLEPFDWRNRRAFGFDMYSEPVRRAAMARARDEETTAISGKVRLVQETEQDVQAGFLMYLPVYRPNTPHATVEERRAGLLGWTYAPFRMHDLMQGILGRHFGEAGTAVDLEIYDGDSLERANLLFDSHEGLDHRTAVYHEVRAIDIFGQRWTLIVHSLPPFGTHQKSERANFILGAGLAGTLLLALVVRLLVTMRSRAVALAESMTSELRVSEAKQRRLNRALRLLSSCNMALVHAEDEYKLLVEICRLCVERGGYLMAWVGFKEDDSTRSVRPIAQSGYESDYLDKVEITWADTARGRGPTGTAIRTGKACVNQDVLDNPAMAPWREAAIRRGYRSSVALPLVGDGNTLGALTVYAREPDAFDAEEVQLLEELATDLAYGIVTLRARAEHAAAKEKVAFLAHFDPLTQLPNRLLLRDRFEQAALLAASESAMFAMLYLDLDNFGRINDGLGHEHGDRVLLAAVERLRGCIASTDTLSRLTGDEFILLLNEAGDAAGIGRVVNSIQHAFAEPLLLDGNPLELSCSIGISLFPSDGRDFDTLLRCAGTAVNSAKEAGRNTYRFFTREMNSNFLEQMRITGALPGALRNREFRLNYQPQIDLRSGRIIGAEALIRWHHPADGLISPAKFIPLAEQSGHIVTIGEWVLHEACRQAQAWSDQGLPPMVIAVNLSAIQFQRGDVEAVVRSALDATGLRPDRLELELTESILLQDMQETMQTLRDLKSLGVKLSIDDFGTGYSSLAYLKHLAVNKLKIDQSFVRDMLTDREGASIVRAIIQLGHTLQLEVIAEGVETEEQLQFLRDSGCDEVQGYLFSRPVPADQFPALLKGELPRIAS